MNATAVAWFIGPPGGGKTTLAGLVRDRMESRGLHAEHIDADEFWRNRPRTFTAAGRVQANTTVAEHVLSLCGHVDAVCISTCAPSIEARHGIRSVLGDWPRFIVCSASDETLRQRRPQLYADANQGVIDWVPFEKCEDALVEVDTDITTPGEASVYVMGALAGKVQGVGDALKAVIPAELCGGCNRRRLWANGLFGRRGLR